jgi:hypothetical protein
MWQAWGQRLRSKVKEMLDASLKDEILIKLTKQTRISAVDERKRFDDVMARLMVLSKHEGSGGDGVGQEATVHDSAVVGESLVKQLEAQLSSYDYHSDGDSSEEVS